MLAEVEALGLEVETLINNAGFGADRAASTRAPAERLLEMIDLNVRALTETCRLVLPAMIERATRGDPQRRVDRRLPGRARTWRSIMRARPMSCRSPRRFTRRMKAKGVKVSALCPGPTATEFFDVAGSEGLDARQDGHRSGRRRRGGPQGPRAEPRHRHSRAREQDRRPEQPLPAARVDAPRRSPGSRPDRRAEAGLRPPSAAPRT